MINFTPTVVRATEDGLTQATWEFWITEKLEIILNVYRYETRPSRRHGFKTQAFYKRLSSGNERSTLTADAVPWPDDVTLEARQQVIDQLTVKKVK